MTTSSSHTLYDPGDVVLISYPNEDTSMLHQRPAMVVHSAQLSDAAVAVVPITPDPVNMSSSLYVAQGSFEAARMGLITGAYLNACSEIIVDRQFLSGCIGRCPWRLLTEFLALQRRPTRSWSGSGSERFLPSDDER